MQCLGLIWNLLSGSALGQNPKKEAAMPKKVFWIGGWFVGFFAFLLHPVCAQDFYKGKRINLIVSYAAGGLYDAHARLLARHLGKHIRGKPSFVVQNMPGAGGIVATNYLYNVAKRDGQTIGTVFRNLALDQALREVKGEKVLYNASQFGWIASTSQETSACIARHDTPFKTIKDLIGSSRPLIAGGSGPGADTDDFPKLANATLGTNFRLISGFPGAAGIYPAMERGEVENMCGTWSAHRALRPDWFRDKFVNVVVYMSVERNPELDGMGVPWVFDLIKDKKARILWETRLIPNVMAWPFFTTPGVSPELLGQLRKSFTAAMKDPAYLAEAKKMMLEIDPVSGEEVENVVKRIFTVPKDLLVDLARILD